MSCLREEVVVALVRGTLASDAETEAEEHVDKCPECRKVVAYATRAFAPSVEHPDLERSQTEGLAPREPEEPLALPPGTQVERYRITACIGAGGMGTVYAALDPALDRKVALKLLRPDVPLPTAAKERRARLLREAQAMARLSHANVVGVYDVGTFGDQIFLAMELLEGRPASAWLKEEQRSWQGVLDLFLEAGSGLAAAHRAGVVHRDFKPDNVLVGWQGRVCVTDFGLARSIEPPTGALAPPCADPPGPGFTLTQTGTLLGTPAYMAPEQFGGQPADDKTDQFSFCVALYEGLVGVRPFAGQTIDEIGKNVREGNVQQTRAFRSLPGWLQRALLRGLSPRPLDRHPSMDVLLHRLRFRRRWRTRGRRLAAVAITGLCLAALLPLGRAAMARAHLRSNRKLGVLLPRDRLDGQSYGQWAGKFWQWAYAMGSAYHPLIDETGAPCSAGQSGHVWFLSGGFGSTRATRTCLVPHGTVLFVALDTNECSQAQGFRKKSEAELRACARAGLETIRIEAEIDGSPVRSLEKYRVQSDLFAMPISDLTPNRSPSAQLGSKWPAIADGYFLMLSLQGPGPHTLHFRSLLALSEFDVTYHLIQSDSQIKTR